jgi:alkanesulfonate monooxygenase SsuD/methylene tetrahydromethanopterin reductase-like flavin-dependent oxidoreductase (luciferase family)
VRYGIVLTAGNIHEIAAMATEAEAAGWDGVFYWDGMAIPGVDPIYDPWVTLAAIAMRTERVRFGAIVTPPSRRRPWKLARETVTLDHLSGGRIVLPVGLGAVDDPGFAGVGEPTDRRIRAELLDESLEILTRAWSGEPFSYEGKHFQMAEMTFRPPSVQQPRIPIGSSPSGRARKASTAPSAMTASCQPSGPLPPARRLLTISGLSPRQLASAKVRVSPSASSLKAPPRLTILKPHGTTWIPWRKPAPPGG